MDAIGARRRPVSTRPREQRSVGRRAAVGVVALLAGAMALLTVAPLWLPSSYSWVEHGTSESAAQGIDGAWVARSGFIVFGVAVVWLVQLRSTAWGWPGTILHLAFGVGMFGVAAFAARPWEDDAPYVESEDVLHSAAATVVGVGFIAGVVAVMVSRRLPSVRAALPDLAALAVAVAVPMTMSTSLWGILQRLMFLTAACWYAREARLAMTGYRAG
jgi:hypothetical protein